MTLMRIPGMTLERATRIEDFGESMAIAGFNLQDPLFILSLTVAHIITAFFVVAGLYHYENKNGFHNMDISVHYIILIIICLVSVLISTVQIIHIMECKSDGTVITNPLTGGTTSIDPITVILYFFVFAFWCVWLFKSVCQCQEGSGCFCSTCGIFITLVFSIAIVLGYMLSTTFAFGIEFIIPILLCVGMKSSKCCKCCYQESCCCYNWCESVACCGKCQYTNRTVCNSISLTIGLMALWMPAWLGLSAAAALELDSDCLSYIFPVWVNPCFIIFSLYLLCTSRRYFIIVFNLNFVMIFVIGLTSPFMCTYVINVVFLGYAFMTPFLIFSLFLAFEPLKEWKTGVLLLYLGSLDEVTTIAVIYSFFASEIYWIYGILQLVFLISSNYFSGTSNKLFGEEYENLTICDKCMAFLGFGAQYFKIKSWSEVGDNAADHIYERLEMKHQIWTVMFETFPSLGLQIYASLVEPNTELSVALTASIMFSCLRVTVTVYNYMLDVAQQSSDTEVKSMDRETDTGSIADIHATNTVRYNQRGSKDMYMHAIELEAAKESGQGAREKDEIVYTTESPTYPSMNAPKPIPSPMIINNSPQLQHGQKLPYGWRIVYTPDGTPYYWNDMTGATQWENPSMVSDEIVYAESPKATSTSQNAQGNSDTDDKTENTLKEEEDSILAQLEREYDEKLHPHRKGKVATGIQWSDDDGDELTDETEDDSLKASEPATSITKDGDIDIEYNCDAAISKIIITTNLLISNNNTILIGNNITILITLIIIENIILILCSFINESQTTDLP